MAELHARFASSAPSFAPFTLDHQRLHHAHAASIELADIDRVARAERVMKTIDNSMLLVQELGSRAIDLQLSSEVFVPETIAPALAVASGKEAAAMSVHEPPRCCSKRLRCCCGDARAHGV